MLITALVLAVAGVLRRGLGRRTTSDRRERLASAVAATRQGAVRLVRAPVPALSSALALFGVALAGTHLVCAGAG
ncbi:hypothetical protein [Nocardia rhizosphaerae]|uniref:Type II secretion protein F n=1 Tax=Nocardia rhizosphaerae TaxID=1691571 RepID=A0ABV8LDV9_9NOCA